MGTVLDQTEDSAPTIDDAVYVVDDPGGSPSDGYMTFSDLLALNAISARIHAASTQTISNGTKTILEMGAVDFQNGALYSSANPNRLTIAVNGRYMITAGAGFNPNSVGKREYEILLNSTTILARKENNHAATGNDVRCLITTMNLSAGDFIQVRAAQNSGDNLGVFHASGVTPALAIALLART